jgi:hypothetical protein
MGIGMGEKVRAKVNQEKSGDENSKFGIRNSKPEGANEHRKNCAARVSGCF